MEKLHAHIDLWKNGRGNHPPRDMCVCVCVSEGVGWVVRGFKGGTRVWGSLWVCVTNDIGSTKGHFILGPISRAHF